MYRAGLHYLYCFLFFILNILLCIDSFLFAPCDAIVNIYQRTWWEMPRLDFFLWEDLIASNEQVSSVRTMLWKFPQFVLVQVVLIFSDVSSKVKVSKLIDIFGMPIFHGIETRRFLVVGVLSRMRIIDVPFLQMQWECPNYFELVICCHNWNIWTDTSSTVFPNEDPKKNSVKYLKDHGVMWKNSDRWGTKNKWNSH